MIRGRHVLRCCLAVVCAGLLGAAVRHGLAAEPARDLPGRIAALVEGLDDDRFGVREESRRELIRVAADPATRDETLRLLWPRANDPKLPFETRETLRALVPPDFAPPSTAETKPTRSTVPTESEIDGWLRDLDAASYAEREQAVTHLQAAAELPAAAGPLLWQLRREFAKAEPSPDALRRIRTIWEAALRTWVTTEPPLWQPPVPSDAEITAAVDRLASAVHLPGVVDWLQPGIVAEREVQLLLSVDAAAPRVEAALKKKLEDAALNAAAVNRVDKLYVAARPAMAAEFWQDGRHHSTQHLLIGVPNQPEGAPRASLFDRCDDKVAHCVSGNSLSPGDHPVGIFFPHPSEMQNRAQFHLVNLPTPRRRMAYAYEAPANGTSADELLRIDVRRRREITARTVARFFEEKRPLTEREIDMLALLDPVETARFVGKHLLSVDDERYDSGSPQAFGNGSRHGWTCYILTTLAIPESGEAVAAAIDKDRVLPPTEEKPYRIDWVAALYLAETAPWRKVDDWLAAQLDRTEPISVREPQAADVGASCAARLLKRAGRDPSQFGLERHEFPELIDLENPGYRFTKPESRAEVKRWWNERRNADANLTR